ncbi:MAG: response regulator [Sphingobacteriales bacterium]|uniref:response regulator transcription factor n=1 Tax=Hydrotalea flava TaxID=714549 RepID=UPI000833925E|nr:response regulator transcription factor [Hydrotalea flava]RTL48569.1 MAG: response regulator [Sphingobacteriales bacterium]
MAAIVLAEDNITFLDKFSSWLLREPGHAMLYFARNGMDLLQQIIAKKPLPDIILMDVEMPIIDGIEATSFIKDQFPSIKIIGLTSHSTDGMAIHALVSGMDAFVGKALAEYILPEAIETVLKGKLFIDTRLEFNIDYILETVKKRKEIIAGYRNALPTLTHKEMAFIILAATSLKYKQVAELMNLSEKSVHGYFEAVSNKLKLTSRQHLTLFAHQHGLTHMADYTSSF